MSSCEPRKVERCVVNGDCGDEQWKKAKEQQKWMRCDVMRWMLTRGSSVHHVTCFHRTGQGTEVNPGRDAPGDMPVTMASRRPPLRSYGTGLGDAVVLLPCRLFSMSLVRPGQHHGGSRLAASSPVDDSIGQVGRQERHGSGMLHIELERWVKLDGHRVRSDEIH